jgi:hypothetical protein
MLSIENDTVLVDKQTTKLQGFRLEDTRRAPVIIIFVDQNKPELLPLRPGQPVPVTVKSRNMEAEIQIITYDEIDDYMDKA